MRKSVSEEVLVKQHRLVSVSCNACGNIVEPGSKNWMDLSDIHEISIGGGYGSNYPEDLETITMDICGTCLKKWVETFKHKPKSYKYNDVDDEGIEI